MVGIDNLVDKLASIVGDKYVLTGGEQLVPYIESVTSSPLVIPALVVIPGSAEEISEVVKYCNRHRIKIAIRGGGSGVSGGVTTDEGGIVLSMERLNKIIEINKIDRLVVAEAGVITATLQHTLLDMGLCFPQNISSSGSSFIGGNVAVASGSPKSLKYGPTKNHVINLEVVLPEGQIIWTGRNVSKNASGYNLTQLLVGSEGTLGIITKVVLQLSTPTEEILALVPFRCMNRLFDCVHQIFLDGTQASSMEFIDRRGYELVSDFLGRPNAFGGNVEGLLWVELEGDNKSELLIKFEKLAKLMMTFTECDVMIAESKQDVKRLWDFRKNIGNAVINHAAFKDLDFVVPRTKIHQMYDGIQAVSERFRFDYTLFGHIGNGNFHINIFDDHSLGIDQAVSEILMIAASLGGVVSGEHGIGMVHRRYLEKTVAADQLRLMKELKKLFDPNNILNSRLIF